MISFLQDFSFFFRSFFDNLACFTWIGRNQVFSRKDIEVSTFLDEKLRLGTSNWGKEVEFIAIVAYI